MKFKPLSDRVILEQEEPENKTASGIVLPDTAQEKPQTGKVVAVGPGKTTDEGKLIPSAVKVGDTVVFSKYGGTELKDPESSKDFIIISEKDILAVCG